MLAAEAASTPLKKNEMNVIKIPMVGRKPFPTVGIKKYHDCAVNYGTNEKQIKQDKKNSLREKLESEYK